MSRAAFLRLSDAASEVRCDYATWMQQLGEALWAYRPDAGCTMVSLFSLIGADLQIDQEVCSGDEPEGALTLRLLSSLDLAGHGRGPLVTTAGSQGADGLPPELASAWHDAGIEDCLVVVALLGDGQGIALTSVEYERIDRGLVAKVEPVAQHLHASLALRAGLEGQRISEVAREAFRRISQVPAEPLPQVTASGRPMHKVPYADCERPHSTWGALVRGQLRLVDQFDERQRRTVVLAPAPDALRALTPVEARIAQMAGCAKSNKEIGFELHISESAAENHLSRALRKMGVRDRLALVTLYTQLEAAGEA